MKAGESTQISMVDRKYGREHAASVSKHTNLGVDSTHQASLIAKIRLLGGLVLYVPNRNILHMELCILFLIL